MDTDITVGVEAPPSNAVVRNDTILGFRTSGSLWSFLGLDISLKSGHPFPLGDFNTETSISNIIRQLSELLGVDEVKGDDISTALNGTPCRVAFLDTIIGPIENRFWIGHAKDNRWKILRTILKSGKEGVTQALN